MSRVRHKHSKVGHQVQNPNTYAKRASIRAMRTTTVAPMPMPTPAPTESFVFGEPAAEAGVGDVAMHIQWFVAFVCTTVVAPNVKCWPLNTLVNT